MIILALAACNTASDTDLSALDVRLVAELEARDATIAALSARLDELEDRLDGQVERDDRQSESIDALDAAVAELVVALDGETSERESADGLLTEDLAALRTELDGTAILANDLAGWQAEVAPLFDYVEVDTTDHSVVFVGANVFVQSGSGSTGGAVNGLGNLFIGYNEDTRGLSRAGSHNLVIGAGHAYLSYGGFIAGFENGVAEPYGSVLGGSQNGVTGAFAAVGGGYSNTASGDYAVVSAGYGNQASGDYTGILGGSSNTSSGSYSTIVGGASNKSSGASSSTLGGYQNTASGIAATVYGGRSQTATTDYSYKP